MSKYVLAFRGQPDRGSVPGEEQAWGAWFTELGRTIVDFGNRVGQVERLDAEQRGDPAKETLTGYVVVEAADIEHAVTLARGCPGLLSGVSVEVAETVPMSG
jgi:hypothetical protein